MRTIDLVTTTDPHPAPSTDALLEWARRGPRHELPPGLARRLLLMAARRSHGPALELIDHDVTTVVAGDAPAVRVEVHDPRAYAALLQSATVGLGRSYVAGWWDAADLTGLVRALSRRTQGPRRRLDAIGQRARLVDLLARRRAPGRVDDARNIAAHYDVSNEFYAEMLDETMTYSCAYFEHPGQALADAQTEKLDRLCRKLALTSDDRVLEIGTGWGSFAIHAASRYGCDVVTTTISRRQRSLAEARVKAAGLAGQVTVLGQDWRDLQGTYDKLVSIEMIEAVDWRHHDRFLATCADRLAPGGLMAMQAIVIDDRSFERAKRHDDFLRRMIFPGGCLPSVSSLASSLARATPLRLVDLEDLSASYPPTLRAWAQNLADHRARVDELGVGEPFLRLWSLYLAYCEAAFLEGHVGDVQLVAAAPRTMATRGISGR